ncbi:Chromosome segregation ATPase, partial [Giardia duodenalis]
KKPAGRVEGGMADSTLDYLANMSGAEMDFYDSKQFEGGASLERSAQGGAMGEGLASRSLSIGVGNAVNEPLSTFNELDIDL